MQRYESYKSSGSLWLGDIPTHWNVLPLVSIATQKSICNCPEKELLSVYLDRGVIKFSDVDEKRTNATSEDLSKYQEVLPGDFVLNNQQAWRGSVGVSGYEGIVSPAYIVLRLKKGLDPRFANYLFRDGAMVSQYLICSKGVGTIQRNLYWPQLKRSRVIVPPQEEQVRIVAFLDQKTAEIDAAIAKKERLIELLHEQKKAAIRIAVTKGIKGSRQLVSHDLSYLKQVPSDWSIKRNKQLFFEKKGVVGKQAPSYTLLSLTLNGVIPRDLDNPKGKFPVEFDTYKKVQPNDMVFCLFDVEETPRTVGLARHVGMITGAYTVVECFDPSLAGYLSYFYTALDDEKMLRPFYTGLRNVIQRNTFFGLQVPIPPENERQEIVEYIDSVIHDTAQLAEKAKQEVISLQEFKNTLVASAVTGRIKV